MKIRLLSLLAAVFTIAALTQAQGPAAAPPVAKLPGSMFMLGRSDVQNDLQLSGGQKAQLETLRQKLIHTPKRGYNGGQNWSGSRSATDAEMARANQQSEAILLDQQRTRLLEIKIQLLGNSALLDPAVQKMVELSDDQKSQILTLQQQQQTRVREQLRSGNLKGKQIVAAIQNSQQQVGAAMIKILTPEQADKYKMIRGRAFHADVDH